MGHTVYLTDGSFDWSGGVDSSRVTTIRSELIPHGLKRNQLAWMNNGTVRGGGILQRTGWQPIIPIRSTPERYQGGYLYEPRSGSDPYFVFLIAGRVYKYEVGGAVIDLSGLFGGLMMLANSEIGWLCQAEEFLVIQDGISLPLIWDGTTLRRSVGIISPNNTPTGGITPYNEIPPATCMDYYMNRLWYAQGRTYGAGDIVYNLGSGTAPYNFRDSVIKVTENPLCFGGDNFAVPDNSGNIRAIRHSANINTQLGQGPLYISTRKAIYRLTVPVTRTNWIAATRDAMPLQEVAQLTNGWVNDRSVVAVNGDLFGQSLEPSIRSQKTAVRNFEEWGNLPISNNVNRALQFNNRALMRFGSGIIFNNRLYETVLPRQLGDNVVHDGMVILDFDIISTLEERLPPAWEGIHEGQQILQLFVGDFGGRDRAFMMVVSSTENNLALWEITSDTRTENGDNRVIWGFEFPAFNFNSEKELKDLVGGEMWISKIFGEVEFRFEYRVDGDPCYRFWHHEKICVARNCQEDLDRDECPIYPYASDSVTYREGWKWAIALPKPKGPCNSMKSRPTNIGYQFQVRVTVKGWCQIRGFLLHATPFEKSIYQGLNCE